MADMTTRDELLRVVHRQLVHRGFAERFEAVGPDGTKPIVVALRADTLAELDEAVRRAGGAANVVVPLLNDALIVFLFHCNKGAEPTGEVSELDADCTVGLLLERFVADGGGTVTYAFRRSASPCVEGSRADHPQVLALR